MDSELYLSKHSFCLIDRRRNNFLIVFLGGCLPAGMFDIGRTRLGSPHIYLSGVHFYHSPPQVYQNFTGYQHPDSGDASHIDIEPVSLIF